MANYTTGDIQIRQAVDPKSPEPLLKFATNSLPITVLFLA